jgi:rhodanese-related sulfurtransferase
MPRGIERNEVLQLIADGAQIVEVLPRSEYDEDHLPGAVQIPLSQIGPGVESVFDRSRPVVVYCWDTA